MAKQSKPSKIVAGSAAASGAGAGTILVFIANSLPDSSPYKKPLLTVVPTITTVLTAGIPYVVLYIKQAHKDFILNKTKNHLSKCLGNPITSEDHKKTIRKKYEDLELLDINNKLQGFQDLQENKDIESLKP